ncbi:MAG: hypothetical protein QM831_15485 [Kofleriaceae bacterium]
MKMRFAWVLGLAACMSNAGDVGDGVDDSFVSGGKADGAVSDGSPEATGVLAVANTLSQSALDNDVGLDSRAAKGIVARRPFSNLASLDAVPYVGPVAFDKLLAYARAHGFITASGSSIALADSAPGSDQAFACRVTNAGTLECWGMNWYGTLGNGAASTFDHTVYAPQAVPGLSNVTAVTAGAKFVVALAAGKVSWWGNDSFAKSTSSSPTAVAGLSNITAITTGLEHACALHADGTASCWGSNSNGQLGDGTKTARATPAVVPGVTNITAIAAGGDHTCALLGTGEVSCWGENKQHQIDYDFGDFFSGDDVMVPHVLPEITGATAIAAGVSHTCAIVSDGDVECWGGVYGAGGSDQYSPIANVKHAVAISAGYAHTCALESTGEVVCWGWAGLGQLGVSTAGCAFDESGNCPTNNPSGRVIASNAVEVVAKGDSTCVRGTDDHITCWGVIDTDLGQTTW